MTLTHKQATAAVRSEIKKAGIKACVFMSNSCGDKYIEVAVPAYDIMFKSDEIKVFSSFAKSIGCTVVTGMEIDVEHESTLIAERQWHFVYHG